jgi:xanthine dehydrogenase iron-sulfur cluster and FAD-binding subunit A
MTVQELLDRTTSSELSEWAEYERIEPFGDRRADLHAAQICWTLASLHSKKTLKLEDFVLDFTPRQPKSPTELLQKVRLINALLGGKDERGDHSPL